MKGDFNMYSSYRPKTVEDYKREREERIKNGGHPKYSHCRCKFFHQERESKETGWDYPIHIDVKAILKRFEENHNREQYFKGNDEEYWTLIKKAIIIACRMAENYREETLDYERYKYDNVTVSGGGGVNSKYTVFTMRNFAFWQPNVGEVEINFKDKTLKVWMNHWEQEGRSSYSYRKEYTKPIDDVDGLLEMYNNKYYYEYKR
jgi:hypothetical protein